MTLIGQRIKQYRNEKGYSLSELAEKAGVAKSYLSSIERNLQTNPSIQFLEKVSAVLDATFRICRRSFPNLEKKARRGVKRTF